VTQDSEQAGIQDNDPTGMWEMAGKIHEMARRQGAILTRRRHDPVTDDNSAPDTTFAEWFERNADGEAPLALWAEKTSAVVMPAPPANGGWLPRSSAVETGRVELTPLDTPMPTMAVRTFPSMADPLALVRQLWPDGDEPIFDEVNTDVTHPLTPTGKLAKCGPKLPLTGGLSFDEFMQAFKEDLRRVDARYHLGMAGLIDAADET
jgi:hypothetical protein